MQVDESGLQVPAGRQAGRLTGVAGWPGQWLMGGPLALAGGSLVLFCIVK